jgi:hypothetical protein
MDYWQALSELQRERERLTTVIRNLESLLGGKQPASLSRRGRKNMSAAERAEVSARMKKYWESRRSKSAK